MGDKRKRDQAIAEENDGAVVEITKSKKVKHSDKESPKKKEKKDKKDKKEKRDKKERKRDKSDEGTPITNGEKYETAPELMDVTEPETIQNGIHKTPAPTEQEPAVEQNGDSSIGKKPKKENKDKKEKKEKKEEETVDEKKKSKRDRKKAKKNQTEIETSADSKTGNPESETANGDAVEDTPNGGEPVVDGEKLEEARRNQRFIVFISNLPYSADQESVMKHFAKLEPMSIRVPLEKNGKKGRGFAFVEFSSFDRMKTCLKLYHGASFDDGKSPARKIKVELTAGGGGSSENRKAKILEKNQKLNLERARDAENAKRKANGEKKAETGEDAAPAGDAYADIHPSRRTRLQF
ncbi:hypothetical protein FQN57_004866 [Myotisia sp. PD_48]|nr:hypothetical protein FQN57_004866 [Myotisia sp. PD_48]